MAGTQGDETRLKGGKRLLEGGSAAMIGLVLINVFWGASSIATKETLLQLSAVEIVTVRFAIALAAVFLIALAFATVTVALASVPANAAQYWYLFCSPVLLAALSAPRFDFSQVVTGLV